MKFRKWTCKKCGEVNKTPAEGEMRIMIVVPEWDFCKRCGQRREEDDRRS